MDLGELETRLSGATDVEKSQLLSKIKQMSENEKDKDLRSKMEALHMLWFDEENDEGLDRIVEDDVVGDGIIVHDSTVSKTQELQSFMKSNKYVPHVYTGKEWNARRTEVDRIKEDFPKLFVDRNALPIISNEKELQEFLKLPHIAKYNAIDSVEQNILSWPNRYEVYKRNFEEIVIAPLDLETLQRKDDQEMLKVFEMFKWTILPRYDFIEDGKLETLRVKKRFEDLGEWAVVYNDEFQVVDGLLKISAMLDELLELKLAKSTVLGETAKQTFQKNRLVTKEYSGFL